MHLILWRNCIRSIGSSDHPLHPASFWDLVLYWGQGWLSRVGQLGHGLSICLPCRHFVCCLFHCCSTTSSASAEQDVIVTACNMAKFCSRLSTYCRKKSPEMIELKSCGGMPPVLESLLCMLCARFNTRRQHLNIGLGLPIPFFSEPAL